VSRCGMMGMYFLWIMVGETKAIMLNLKVRMYFNGIHHVANYKHSFFNPDILPLDDGLDEIVSRSRFYRSNSFAQRQFPLFQVAQHRRVVLELIPRYCVSSSLWVGGVYYSIAERDTVRPIQFRRLNPMDPMHLLNPNLPVIFSLV